MFIHLIFLNYDYLSGASKTWIEHCGKYKSCNQKFSLEKDWNYFRNSIK